MSCQLRSLYICYYPLTEPLVQTQVVAYLAELAERGHTLHLLTYEMERLSAPSRRSWSRRMKAQGITWHHLRYHKRPSLPATVYDVLSGIVVGLRIIRRHHIEAVHARSHVAACMGLVLKWMTGCRLIFDMRGLLAEEYEDAGIWQRDSLPFRLVKLVERRCLASADGVVVLTERVKRELLGANAPRSVHVIPCCADIGRIQEQREEREAMRAELGLQGKTVMVYVGKFGTWYMHREMVEFFATARSTIHNLHFLVLTQSDPGIIKDEFERHHLTDSAHTVTQCDPSRVGAYLAAADCALSFIRACPSKIASSPTKIGEYLAAGLPVICNSGIGDLDEIIGERRTGVILKEFSWRGYLEAAHAIQAMISDESVGDRCRAAATATASLREVGGPRYHALYCEVANTVRPAPLGASQVPG